MGKVLLYCQRKLLNACYNITNMVHFCSYVGDWNKIETFTEIKGQAGHDSLSASCLLLSLEWNDTEVYEPSIRAFLATALHSCEVVHSLLVHQLQKLERGNATCMACRPNMALNRDVSATQFPPVWQDPRGSAAGGFLKPLFFLAFQRLNENMDFGSQNWLLSQACPRYIY